MDGGVKIALIVTGPCSPAPLVRLISPGTFVAQVGQIEAFANLATYDGPGVAALVPDSSAWFIHDPRAGRSVGERLSIQSTPDLTRRKSVGGLSAAQQREELELLESMAATLASTGAAVAPDTSDSEPPDPADKLAAWLLTQADLTGTE